MVNEESEGLSFNDDIFGGIKAAIERGEDLKDAMVSFYNAGYTKREIEEAARKYVMEKRQREASLNAIKGVSNPKGTKEKEKDEDKTKKLDKGKQQDLNQTQQTKEQQRPANAAGGLIKKTIQRPVGGEINQTKQIVSKYEQNPKKKKHAFEPITIILILLLVFLVLILGSVFLFKEELVTFFNNLFG